MINAGIIGATGYGGRETIRILLGHPQVRIVLLAADPSFTGRRIDQVYPEFESVLRAGNYLTRDPRMVERKKYGQRGARRRFQFSKR